MSVPAVRRLRETQSGDYRDLEAVEVQDGATYASGGGATAIRVELTLNVEHLHLGEKVQLDDLTQEVSSGVVAAVKKVLSRQ